MGAQGVSRLWGQGSLGAGPDLPGQEAAVTQAGMCWQDTMSLSLFLPRARHGPGTAPGTAPHPLGPRCPACSQWAPSAPPVLPSEPPVFPSVPQF